MARIPLRDIPNAPQVVAQPQGSFHQVNLGRAQSLLQQQTVDPAPFMAPARGLQAVAEGIGKIQGASEKWIKAAIHLQNLVDEDMVFKGELELMDAAAAANQKILADPENYTQYGEIVRNELATAYDNFLAKYPNLSDTARRQFEQKYELTSRRLYQAAQEKAIAKATANAKARAELQGSMFAEAGDVPSVVEHWEDQRGKGIFSDVEIDAKKHEAVQAAERQQLADLKITRPDVALEWIRDPERFTALSPVQRLQEERSARAQLAAKDAETMNQVVVAFERGEVKTPEDVEKRFGEYGKGFVERNLANVKRALKPREYSDFGKAAEILQEIKTMDLPPDPDERARVLSEKEVEFNAVLLPGEGGPLREELKRFKEEAVEGKRKPLEESIDIFRKGILDIGGFGGGYDKKKANDGNAKEIEKRTKQQQNALKADQELSEWRRRNPKASDSDVMRAYQEILLRNGWLTPPKKKGFWERVGEEEEKRLDRIFERYKAGANEWKKR